MLRVIGLQNPTFVPVCVETPASRIRCPVSSPRLTPARPPGEARGRQRSLGVFGATVPPTLVMPPREDAVSGI